MRALPLVALLLLAFPTASAQPVLYVIGDGREIFAEDPYPAGNNGTWEMGTAVPPDNESIFHVRFGGGGFGSSSLPTWNYTGGEGPVVLAGEDPVRLYAYVDHLLGGVCDRVRAQLYDQDGNATGPARDVRDIHATPSIDELVWTFDGLAGEFPSLGVQLTPVPGRCANADFYFGSAQYRARLVLGPEDRVGLPPPPEEEGEGPEVVHANLTGPTADIALQYPSHPVNRTFFYSWENPHDRLQVSYEAIVSEGSMDLLVEEVEGETVLDHALEEDASHNETWKGTGPGPWMITIAVQGFVGRLDLSIDDAGDAPASTDTQTQTGTNTGTATNTSTDGPPATDTDTETGNDTPGVGFVTAVVLLGLGVVAARRRLG